MRYSKELCGKETRTPALCILALERTCKFCKRARGEEGMQRSKAEMKYSGSPLDRLAVIRCHEGMGQ